MNLKCKEKLNGITKFARKEEQKYSFILLKRKVFNYINKNKFVLY